jgi:ATP-binding cassette subfamily B protein
MIYNNHLTVGGLITAQVWWNQACGMIESLGDRYQDFLREVSSVKKFFDLIDLPIAIKEVENPVHLKSVEGYIQFKGVSFSYPKPDGKGVGKEVLQDISIRINAGEKVAIVGPTGSGKTTLMTLLFRGYDPDRGSVEVDGYDVRDLSPSDYYKHIAVVDQSCLMMDGTIRDNIRLGVQSDNFSDDNMHQLCRLAELDAMNFPEGLDKQVGQDGKHLSGGERQRLAIIRALAGNPKILVLDEATASLDGITEAKIQKAIDLASAGRTTIIIAHRLPTAHADRAVFVIVGQPSGSALPYIRAHSSSRSRIDSSSNRLLCAISSKTNTPVDVR